ncbi:MAG: hypothetical protein KKG00_08525 [Bacteroidetes bacterium]|nr:hypothetical protein [Bacteroidota bacterium]
MKATLYILAVYTVLLACIPCQDDAVVRLDATPVLSMSAAADHPPHNTADLCSPFCICTCCTGLDIPVLKTFLPEKPVANPTTLLYVPYASAVLPGCGFSIWQPPRV